MTGELWIALTAILLSIFGGVAVVAWHARGVKSSTDHLSDRMQSLDQTLVRLTDKVDGIGEGAADNRERIVRLETQLSAVQESILRLEGSA